MIKDKIKVVIWDLDDTLWKGTLAEGDDVQLLENRVAIIKELNKRGIVNAICSKMIRIKLNLNWRNLKSGIYLYSQQLNLCLKEK